MRRVLPSVLVLCALAIAGPLAAAEWSTSYGAMTLPDDLEPGALRAEYGRDEGRIIGTLVKAKCLGCGLMFDGIWVEAGSAKECPGEQDGSPYWGAVSLEFDAAATSFGGKWDYCGEGKTYNWRGQVGSRGLTMEDER